MIMTTRVDGQTNLCKGDRFRFTEDYYLDVKPSYEERMKYPTGKRVLLAAEGVEGRVIWAGRSYDSSRLGSVRRLGVLVPGRSKPVFVNQRYMAKIA